MLRGRDPRSGRPVAIKIVGTLEENRPRSERVVDRVFNALTGLKSAGHPSVPRILEVGRIGGGAVFLVSEWVEGHVLEASLEVPPQTVLNYATQVVSVLESMARYGLAHLNLRPNNLMVDATGRVQLLGLASGYLVDSGSLQRSAPELSTQLASGGALWRCDLYSLASTTCQLLDVKVEGAGTPVPFVGFSDEVRQELRGSEGLRLVLESALHRAATRRPASLGVFRRALLNCLDDAEESRPIPLHPLPLEYRSETGSVKVKDSAPILLFESDEDEPAEMPANDVVAAEAAQAEVAAEATEALEVAATSGTRPVDVDADLAEYVALAGGAPESVAFEAEPISGRLRLVADRPSAPAKSEVLVAKAGEARCAPEGTEVPSLADLEDATGVEDEDSSNEPMIALEEGEPETSEAEAPAQETVAASGTASFHPEPAQAEGPSVDSQQRETESAEPDAVSDTVVAAETVAIEAPKGEASPVEAPHEEKPMSPEPQQPKASNRSGGVSKEFVLGRDLVPEELLDGAAAAAEARMPAAHREPTVSVTTSIELDEGTAIGADSGLLHLEEVAASVDTGEEPSMAATQSIEVSGVGDVPTAEDLFDEHQPEATSSDPRRTMPLELVKSELEDERALHETDATLDEVLSGAALARPGASDEAAIATVDEENAEPAGSYVAEPQVEEDAAVAVLSSGDLAEWSDSVDSVEAPTIAFAGSSAKKKASGIFSANAIRGLFVVAAILWAAFAVLWFRQEGRLKLGESAPAVALQPSATEPSAPAEGVSAPASVVASEASTAEPGDVVDPSAVEATETAELEAPVEALERAADATRLEPAPLVATSTLSEEVGAAVRGWAAAWSRQDVEGYLSTYSQSFKPNNGASRAQWAAYRRDRVSAPNSVTVTVDQLEVSVDGERATAVLRQEYSSDSMSDKVLKTLTLANEAGGWKIVSEVSKPLG
ncbi:MAG: hypothetical protein AAF690_13675 [Acidobacteriota bacterium]